jgi:hypothetical protein
VNAPKRIFECRIVCEACKAHVYDLYRVEMSEGSSVWRNEKVRTQDTLPPPLSAKAVDCPEGTECRLVRA